MNHDIPEAIFHDYLRMLRETQQWRLNFGYLTYRERFLEIARYVATWAARSQSATGKLDSTFLEKTFLGDILDLLSDWGAPLTKAAGM
jgi:hypothetical protein